MNLLNIGLEFGLGEVRAKSVDNFLFMIFGDFDKNLQLRSPPLVASSFTGSETTSELFYDLRCVFCTQYYYLTFLTPHMD